jgi:hypothetical protein
MHPAARRLPPYALASLTAFLVIALPAAACACLAGAAMLVLSLLIVLGGASHGDWTDAFAGGIAFALVGVVGTLTALFAIAVLGGLLAGPIVTSLALLVRLLLQALGVRSRIAAAALFVFAGHLLGLVLAGGVHLLGTWLDWRLVERPFALFMLYVLILVACVAATTVHSGVLIATDTAGSLARRAASAIREATARPVP